LANIARHQCMAGHVSQRWESLVMHGRTYDICVVDRPVNISLQHSRCYWWWYFSVLISFVNFCCRLSWSFWAHVRPKCDCIASHVPTCKPFLNEFIRLAGSWRKLANQDILLGGAMATSLADIARDDTENTCGWDGQAASLTVRGHVAANLAINARYMQQQISTSWDLLHRHGRQPQDVDHVYSACR